MRGSLCEAKFKRWWRRNLAKYPQLRDCEAVARKVWAAGWNGALVAALEAEMRHSESLMPFVENE